MAPVIDVKWSDQNPAPSAIRWTGMLLPNYGPAYKGPWSEQKDKDAFDGAIRGSRDNNASVAFRFHGKSIRVIGKTGPNGGFADIALDVAIHHERRAEAAAPFAFSFVHGHISMGRPA